MSDFDKEAERERLREKYGEDDEEKREATEQMSELLLKGATMTNAHCNNCGDPIFRYDGQEFCPTCQRPVDRGEPADDGDDAAGDNIEMTTPSEDATVQFGDQATDEPDPADDSADAVHEQPPTHDAADAATEHPPASTGTRTQPAPSTSDQSAESPDQHPRTAPSVDPAETATADGTVDRSTDDHLGGSAGTSATDHLTNAQTLLAQTVEGYAKRARDADSPRQAREYLEAAREAAAALDETGF